MGIFFLKKMDSFNLFTMARCTTTSTQVPQFDEYDVYNIGFLRLTHTVSNSVTFASRKEVANYSSYKGKFPGSSHHACDSEMPKNSPRFMLAYIDCVLSKCYLVVHRSQNFCILVLQDFVCALT